MNLKFQDYIGIGGIVATILVGVVTAIISIYLTRKSINKSKLNYEMRQFPIISKNHISQMENMEVYYNGELLPDPYLLSVDIINSGNIAIENPPIEIEASGATYIIPGYIEDIPDGYDTLWKLERTDAESCAIKIEHINPGQVLKARFFLDELPSSRIKFKCPMKNVDVKELNTELKQVIIKNFTDVILGVLSSRFI